jgi:methionyl-tRNA formyltransferase
MIDTSEGEFKVWQESAVSCHNRLRGFSMWPQAFMYLQVGEREAMKVKVTETRVVARDDTTADLEATDVVQLGPTKQSGLYVVCFDGSILELVEVQPATRKAFRARDFQNGYPGETIRWVRTPEDQAADPEKYNSRAAKV